MAAHVGSRLSRVAAAGTILPALLLVLSLGCGPSRATADLKEGAAASSAEASETVEAAEAVQAPPQAGKEAAHKEVEVHEPQSREAAQKPEKREAAQRPEKPQNPEEAGNGGTGSADEPPMIDPLSVNAACYVCHMTFIGEELSTVHFQEKTMCIDCHGLSAPHANDENIGATPPDIVFKRDQVDASCEKCHEDHDAPGADVVARFVERKLADPHPICTDCHGTHKIEREEAEDDVARSEPPGKTES